MERSCFDSVVTLNVYERNGYRYINCICRERSLVLLPEEEVRQAVLTYLIQYSKINLERFHIKVEYNSLDIGFYLNYNYPNFIPSQSPALIFELKRDFTNLYDWIPQLENYMNRLRCNYGILTNSSDILFIDDKSENRIKKMEIFEIEEKINELKFNIEEDVRDFKLAQEGSLNAFERLINKFGKTSKFTFVCEEYSLPITCFFLDILDNYVLFNFCNVESRRKQPKIPKSSFLKLLAIYE